MIENKISGEKLFDEGLRSSSGYLAHALIASHRELNLRWIYEFKQREFEASIEEALQDREEPQEGELFTVLETQQLLGELKKNAEVAWENAVAHVAPQYREKVMQAREVMDFANNLVLKSANPQRLLAVVDDKFATPWKHEHAFSGNKILPGIFLVRQYVELSADKQEQVLAIDDLSILNILGEQEVGKMKRELSVPHYSDTCFADIVAADILIGKLKLPNIS